MTKWTALICSALWCCFSGIQAQAASISLTTATPDVALNGSVLFDVNMDFSADPTVGGGFDIGYDHTKLQFSSFAFDTNFSIDPSLSNGTPDQSVQDQLIGLAFGSFGGLSGPAKVGTLTFNAIGLGATALSVSENISPYGGFFSAATYTSQAVNYSGASVNVVAPVPVPPAAWLMLSALGLSFRAFSTRRMADQGDLERPEQA